MVPEQFDDLVGQVLDDLPAWVRAAFDNVTIMVEDAPDPELLADGEDLLGLYTGTPLPERGVNYGGVLPDVIYIFRQPHLALGLAEPELREEIARTVLHEIAHYFGIDDQHLEANGFG
jgi:predicted Zn-dependent protease with MMP-like domain